MAVNEVAARLLLGGVLLAGMAQPAAQQPIDQGQKLHGTRRPSNCANAPSVIWRSRTLFADDCYS